ncbi:Transcriptional regulator [Penicillium sp. DV-2018c]|nr:Transcriptional regulator [Penicillium sp. DV-2018c]KAJ5565986.1 Transcriptional regulator [Penicillium sp. DV-2018c]
MPPKYAMSDSESDAEGKGHTHITPSDEALEQSLRDAVAAIFKSGNMDELTLKRVRLAAEAILGLTQGYFKSSDVWKTRSEEIIKDEVALQDQAALNPKSSPTKQSFSSPQKHKQATPAKRAKADRGPKPRKRQKTKSPVADEDEDLSAASGDESDEIAAPAKRSKTPAKKGSAKETKKDVAEDSDVLSGDENEGVAKAYKQSKAPVKKAAIKKAGQHVSDASDVSDDASHAAKPTGDAKDESESEMSEVLDEEPKPKASRKQQKAAKGAVTKTQKVAKKDEAITPDQAEIKRLQGWLIKCGIRKLWGKELAPYETPKAKINHLKKMLADAGMTGRPSQEKANQIREARELKADLELIQEGAKKWGAKDDEKNDESDGAQPRRRLARGRQALAFLDSDGEESD